MQRLRAEMGGFAALSIKIEMPKGGGRLRRPEPKPEPTMEGIVRADDVFFLGHKKTSEQSELCSDVAQKEGFEPSLGLTRLLP